MKILFYINILSDGGAERVMSNLANQFAANGDEIFLVTTYKTPREYSVSDRVQRINLEEKPNQIKNRVIRNISRIAKLRRIIKSKNPEVVVSFMKEPNFRNIIATRGLKTKTIVSVRNDPRVEYSGRIGRFIANNILTLADGCVFQTQEEKEFFSDKLTSKSTIIFNSVKDEFYNIERRPISGNIVTLGRLSKQKNHQMLIDAFSLVLQEYSQSNLNIYGDGELKDYLTMKIIEDSLCNSVFLKGNTENVSDVLSTADIFVLSSNFEGMPNALMEAMAAGVPSIATDCPCGGPRVLIKQGVSGILVPTNDAQALAKAIIDLLKNNVKKKELGVNAQKAAEAFRPSIVFNDWNIYVREVVKS